MAIEDILNNPNGEELQDIRDLTPTDEEVVVIDHL